MIRLRKSFDLLLKFTFVRGDRCGEEGRAGDDGLSLFSFFVAPLSSLSAFSAFESFSLEVSSLAVFFGFGC